MESTTTRVVSSRPALDDENHRRRVPAASSRGRTAPVRRRRRRRRRVVGRQRQEVFQASKTRGLGKGRPLSERKWADEIGKTRRARVPTGAEQKQVQTRDGETSVHSREQRGEEEEFGEETRGGEQESGGEVAVDASFRAKAGLVDVGAVRVV